MGGGFTQRVIAALICAVAGASAPALAAPLDLHADPLPLARRDNADDRRVGELVFLGGLHLRASQEGFGGFSGLHVSPDGTRLLAVSDMGYWFEADLVHDAQGGVTGMRNARLSPMLGLDGKPLSGKRDGDAEGLDVDGDTILVSFEHRHRIWRYQWTDDMAKARPAAVPAPADIATIKRNKGLEAVVSLPGGRLLLLTEESLDGDGHIRGWLGRTNPGEYAPLRVKRNPPFAVTDAALLPGGSGLLILERRFSALGGLGIKLRRVAPADIAPGAVLSGADIAEFRPGQNIDNFEGLAVRADGDGAIVYLLSDDNFKGFQRTLLMNFRLKGGAAPGH